MTIVSESWRGGRGARPSSTASPGLARVLHWDSFMKIGLPLSLCLMAVAASACDPSSDDEAPEGAGTDAMSEGGDSDGPDQPTSGSHGGPVTGGEPDPESGSDSDNEPEIDPACLEEDPSVDASLSLALEGWEDVDLLGGYAIYDIDDDCIVSSVDVAGGVWTTELECGDDETPRTATVAVAAADDGAPAWSEGEALQLIGDAYADSFGGPEYLSLLRDGVVVLQVIRGDDVESTLESLSGPISADASYETCDAPMPGAETDEIGRLSLTFERQGQSIELISGQRGSLEFEDGSAAWIDVAHAESNHCCHGFHYFEVLERHTAGGA